MTTGLNCSQMWRSKLLRSKQIYHLEFSKCLAPKFVPSAMDPGKWVVYGQRYMY